MPDATPPAMKIDMKPDRDILLPHPAIADVADVRHIGLIRPIPSHLRASAQAGLPIKPKIKPQSGQNQTGIQAIKPFLNLFKPKNKSALTMTMSIANCKHCQRLLPGQAQPDASPACPAKPCVAQRSMGRRQVKLGQARRKHRQASSSVVKHGQALSSMVKRG